MRRLAAVLFVMLLVFTLAPVPVYANEPMTPDQLEELLKDETWYDTTPICSAQDSSGSDIPGGTPEQNGKSIFDFFLSKGLKPFQAAGIIGNMTVESGLEPQRKQGTRPGVITPADEAVNIGGGWGLVQFTPAGKFIKTQGPAPYAAANNIGTQLNFIWDQLEGRTSSPEGRAGREIKGTPNIEEATKAWQGTLQVGGKYFGYERPGDENASINIRIRLAKAALQKYGSGAPESIDTSTDAVAGTVTNENAGTGCNTTGDANGTGADGWQWPAKDINPGPCWNARTSMGYHAGMDMNTTKAGNPALAAHNGTVTKAGPGGAAGNYVTIKVNDNLFYSYEHLKSIAVKVGEPVKSGQTVGIIGLTGNLFVGAQTKGHLHMVVAVKDTLGSYSSTSQKNGSTRDPMQYLPAASAPDNYKCSPKGA